MRRYYFCVLKKDIKANLSDFVRADFLDDKNPSMSEKVLCVSRDYRLEHGYKFIVHEVPNLYGYIPESCIESLIEVGPNGQEYFIDRDRLEIPVVDTQKKWDAVNHVNPSIEHRYMLHDIFYDSWYAADGFKFDKMQGKVFTNKQDAIDVLIENSHLPEGTIHIINLDEVNE